jgi:aldehyde dehydrogenase (NAD+)
MDPTDRARCLFRLADLIEKNAAELAAIEAINNGKPVEVAKAADLTLTHRCYRYYGGWVDKIRGHTIAMDGPFNLSTRKEPVGVVGQVIPWNFPLLMQAWKLAPALAAGCTVVMKTAEQTPLSALRVAELINEAGFPAGVVNIVSGHGDIGAHLARHPGIDKVAFTGSTEVGYDIMRNAHDKNLKRVTLELGGKSPNIITKNANFETALSQSALSLFFNAGQCCVAGSRTYVHSSLYDRYVSAVGEVAKKIRLGHSLAADTEQGPLVSEEQMNRVLGFIEHGKKEGAKLVTGGKRWGSKGWYVEPTVFADVKDEHTIAREEIFGPVKSIFKYDDLDEVIQRANNSSYGLGAGVVTDSHSEANYFIKKLRVGTVYVNCYNVFASMTPFGGFKDSGIGRELGEEGLNNYLELKTIIEKI